MQEKIKFLSLLLGLITLDILTKVLAYHYLPFHFNNGLFLGALTHAPAEIRIVSVSTLAGFLLLIYCTFLYLLPQAVKQLILSVTVILAGILGNVVSRIWQGATIDFIPSIILPGKYFFNFADIFLVGGAAYFIYVIFKYDKTIWFENNNRGNYLVNPKEQIRLALKFSFLAFVTSIILGLYTFSFFKSDLIKVHNATTFQIFLFYSIVTLTLCCLVFLMGIIIAHRSSGPLYAFENYVEKLLNDQSPDPLTLRDGDNHKHLEQLARKLHDHFNKKS